MRQKGVFIRQRVRNRPRPRRTLAAGGAPRSARSRRTAAAFRGTKALSLPERLRLTGYGVSEPAVPVGEAPRPAPSPCPARASRQVRAARPPPRLRAWAARGDGEAPPAGGAHGRRRTPSPRAPVRAACHPVRPAPSGACLPAPDAGRPLRAGARSLPCAEWTQRQGTGAGPAAPLATPALLNFGWGGPRALPKSSQGAGSLSILACLMFSAHRTLGTAGPATGPRLEAVRAS
ncbi:skin secretory protein xP2-like [Eumetopias jubatus]|uniref:skin secretory protein xP2-like n=1 Tax=Eumetopias jubatus TaxID=34886 RepID=UPI0010170DBD|nr:skin secretory protein xP2-like [Eumetopias jubatus]